MRLAIRNPKDFWAGLIFLAFAVGFLLVGRDYGMGRATRMGPGYFPAVLAGLLAVVGIATMLRALATAGEEIRGFALKPLLLLLGAAIVFGVLLRGLGLVLSIVPLVLISAYGSVYFRWPTAVALAVGLAGFCWLLFVKALGLPIPTLGYWLDS